MIESACRVYSSHAHYSLNEEGVETLMMSKMSLRFPYHPSSFLIEGRVQQTTVKMLSHKKVMPDTRTQGFLTF
jgi:hypothetical protein